MGKLIEGLWDCSYCGNKGIKGSVRECPSCGRPRDAKTKFYLPKKYSYVPEEKAQKINRNPDWVCRYCGESLNSDNDEFCKSCGAARTDENLTYHEAQKKEEAKAPLNNGYQAKEVDNKQAAGNVYEPKYVADNVYEDKKEETSKRLNLNWNRIISILLALVILATGIYFLIPKEKTITIEELRWERTIQIELLKTFDESDWSLPIGARCKRVQSELYGYEQVLDHYETRTREVPHQRISGYEEYVVGTRDLGNGYFEEVTSSRPVYETYYETETYQEPIYRDEPIYKDKYYYEIDRWVYERSVDTSGNDKNVYWGEVDLGYKEREGSRIERYYIKGLEKKGKEMEVTIEYDVWKELTSGDTIVVIVDIFGHARLGE